MDPADQLSRRAAARQSDEGPTREVGRLRQAALLAAPDRLIGYVELAAVMRARSRPLPAAQWLGLCRRLAPDDAHTLALLADALAHARNPTAIDARRLVVLAQPDRARHYALLGATLTLLNRARDALPALARAVRVDPNDATGLTNLGATWRITGALGDADTVLRRALVLAPDDRRIAWNFGRLRLTRGDLAAGWRHYDAGLGIPMARPLRRALPAPLWRGEALAGRAVLVIGEQGIGDEMLFATCLPDLIARGADCTLEVEPRLLPLFRRAFPTTHVATHGDPAIDRRRYDTVVPMASLPRWLRPSYAAFPATSAVLRADPARVAHWRRVLDDHGPRPWIGFGWRSGLMRTERLWYYPDVDDWSPLFDVAATSLVSLQHGDVAAERAAFANRWGHAPTLLPGLDPGGDLDELAAAMMALDLVISVGTATRVLAGALGRPTWYVGPWPNWMFLGRESCPFFPAERAYHRRRETPWRAVMEKMATDLSGWLSAARAGHARSPA